MNTFNNEQVANLPEHLAKYIVDQHYEKYTPIDHAVWRYVMRQNYSYLKDAAYYPYIPGLKMAGLTIEKIPSLQEINDALANIGWGAVTVDGFIPPAAFMEFQAYRVLVIAADIRQIEHIEYTSAPDIIHESAGHAPIISDTDYNQYLSYLGFIGTKAIFSSKDFELYETIRQLSILKEMPGIDEAVIKKTEATIFEQQQNIGEPSEMALLSRLQWWTVEYGLIGPLDQPKIYGAGLLSSIGESASCMRPEVKKIPYTIDALTYSYDITKPQPQLFVTPTFQNLIDVLKQFESTMAFRVGGLQSVLKAVECKNICTAAYSSGLQVSGVFTQVLEGPGSSVAYIKTTGPTALSFNHKQLHGHGKNYHADGFGSPAGHLIGATKPLEDFTEQDLRQFGIAFNNEVVLSFESGIKVQGILRDIKKEETKNLIFSFTSCTVTSKEGLVLFDPAWGVFDMAVGASIVSVFNGPADISTFEDQLYVSPEHTHQPSYSDNDYAYHALSAQVRNIREQIQLHGFTRVQLETLGIIFNSICAAHKNDWLCALEILEIVAHEEVASELAATVSAYVEAQKNNMPEFTKLIGDGLAIIDAQLTFQ
jgi:phenylalanine-4-hydroxylase